MSPSQDAGQDRRIGSPSNSLHQTHPNEVGRVVIGFGSFYPNKRPPLSQDEGTSAAGTNPALPAGGQAIKHHFIPPELNPPRAAFPGGRLIRLTRPIARYPHATHRLLRAGLTMPRSRSLPYATMHGRDHGHDEI